MRTLSVLFGSEDREDRTSANSLRELSAEQPERVGSTWHQKRYPWTVLLL